MLQVLYWLQIYQIILHLKFCHLIQILIFLLLFPGLIFNDKDVLLQSQLPFLFFDQYKYLHL
jgi:hypothetical protein